MSRGRAGRARPRREPDANRGLGGEQVEGRRAVLELLAAGRRPVLDVWLSTDSAPSATVGRIEELARQRGVPLRRVARARLDAAAMTEAPQGVLAHARPLPEADLDELCQARGADGRPPFVLAVEGVTDPRNLGALLRSAEAAGVTGAVVPRHRAVRVTPAVAKAAAGAIEHVPVAVVGGMPAALARARDLGCWVVGLATDGETRLFDLPVADQAVVLVVGSEGAGLSRLARARCDLVASIPMRGALASLNVGAAGALALFEVSRRR